MKLLSNHLVKHGHKIFSSKLMTITAKEDIRIIPTRKGLPFIGTSLSIIANGSAPKLHLYIDKGHKMLGPIFRENMGTTSAVFIADPTLMRQVFKMEGKYPKHFLPQSWTIFNEIHSCKRGLFFMDDEEWLHYRRLMNKYFLKDDTVATLTNVHQEVVNYLINRWKAYEGKEITNLEHEFYRHSISFLIGSLMGSSYIKDIYNLEKDIERLASIFHNIFATTSKLNGMPVKLMATFSLPAWKKFELAVQSSLIACKEVVEKMMKTRSADGLLDKLVNENLPLNTVVAIVVDLILAAGDTTAITSQWSLYLLSGHKNIQEATVKGECDVKNVVKEALRMYPPAVFISRTMPEVTRVSGYTLPKGELILMSLYSAGRNDDIYPSSNLFKPERWIRSSGERDFEGVNDPKAFLPFAIGARACIGKNLALAQLHRTIHEIVCKYEMELEEEVDMILRLVPVPSKPIKIKIKTRKYT